MDKILAPIKQRILKYLEYKEVEKKKFFDKINVSASNFRSKSLYSEVGGDVIAKISSLYPEISPNWLLTGKGSMLIDKTNRTENIKNTDKPRQSYKDTKKEDKNNDKNKLISTGTGIPLIPVDALAGFGEGNFSVMDYETDCYVVPEFSELSVDFMIRVKGTSMQPKYNSGDLAACKKLTLTDVFFQWNKVYVLATTQGALIKRIMSCDKEDHIQLLSDNERYPPFVLAMDQIHAIALVVGVIRLE